MRKKKQHQEEHVDETWLLPYSDMLTLLLALFIVMFAMSKVDNNKLQQISQGFNVVFTGGTGVLNGNGKSYNGISISGEGSGTTNAKSKGKIEQDKMTEVQSKLQKEIKAGKYSDKIKVDLGAEGLSISIQDTVIFNSGKADILGKFQPVLYQISNMLRDLDNDIRISGYTDNVPIRYKKVYRSNWDLSYARASNVMNFIVNSGRIKPERFSIQACGEYKPKYDNSTDIGRAKNRRVDILIVRKYTLETKDNK